MKKFLLILAFTMVMANFFQLSAQTYELGFLQKYTSGTDNALNVQLTWDETKMTEVVLSFPDDITINDATSFGSGYWSMSSAVTASTSSTDANITWTKGGGFPSYQSPKESLIDITIPGTRTGDIVLDIAYTFENASSEWETVNTTITLAELSQAPKLVLQNTEWNGGVTDNTTGISQGGIMVYNDGADVLSITGLTGFADPFMTTASFPLEVPSQTAVEIPIEFYSATAGIFSQSITVESNGGSGTANLTAASYDATTYALEDFEEAEKQMPPVGWTMTAAADGTAWESNWGEIRFKPEDDGDQTSTLFTPAINVDAVSNPFISFKISRTDFTIGHFNIYYSNDGTTWTALDENVEVGQGLNDEYYKSLSGITGMQVKFKIEATFSYSYVNIDNFIIPAYYNPETSPSCPENLKPANGDTELDFIAAFSWDKVLYAEGYKLYIDKTGTFDTPIDVADVNLYLQDIDPSENYQWKIAPYNTHGENQTCATQSFTTMQYNPTAWTTDFAANTLLTENNDLKYDPEVNMTSKGEVYVSWFQQQYGNLNFRTQLYTVDGQEKFRKTGVTVSDNPQNTYLSAYGKAVDNNDNLVSAIVDIRTETSDAFAYKISETGTHLWGENGIALTADIDNAVYNTQVLVDSENNVIVMVNHGATFTVIKLDENGTKLWSKTVDTELIKLKLAKNNDIYYGTFSNPNFLLQGLDAATGNDIYTTEALVISTEPGFPFRGPKVGNFEMDKNGGFYFTWYSPRGNMADLKWQYIKSDLTVTTAEAYRLSTNETRARNYMMMQYDELNDKCYLMWNESSSNDLNATYVQTLTQELKTFDADGKIMMEENTTLAGIDAFRIKDNMLVVWWSNFDEGEKFLNYMNVSFYDKNFDLLTAGTNFEKYSTLKHHKPLKSVVFGETQAVMVWLEDRDAEGDDIYAQNLIWANYANGGTTSISDTEKTQFRVYPNPANDYLKIETADKITNLKIVNIQGQVVLSKENQITNNINISKLNAGVYFITVKTENNIFTEKLLVK